jgi:hypothetical protein
MGKDDSVDERKSIGKQQEIGEKLSEIMGLIGVDR